MKPHVSVVTLIIRKGKVLMIKRGDPPHNGKWALPGGHLEFGEKLEEAAIREVKEETGMVSRILRFIAYHNEIISEGKRRFHIVLFCFEGKITGGRLVVGPDVKNVEWKDPKNMNLDEIVPSIRDFLKIQNII